MIPFHRRGPLVITRFTEYEVALITSLVGQLVELLSDGLGRSPEPDAAEGDDPFAQWERDLHVEPEAPRIPDDPVLQRLFPDAYPHDDEASRDFRRFTQSELRDSKVHDARTVLDDLAATRSGRHELAISPDHVQPWLRTLTNLRLSLASRLAITDEESLERLDHLREDDPRRFLLDVYELLTAAQETLVQCLS